MIDAPMRQPTSETEHEGSRRDARDVELPAAPPLLSHRELQLPSRRLLLVSFVVVICMAPVGAFLAVLGRFVLEISGGAANDTTIVVAVAAFAVADFWGGGVVAAVTKEPARRILVGWAIARAALLVAVTIALPSLIVLAPVEFVLGVTAAYFGARMSHKQASLRRAAEADRASLVT